MTGKVSVILAQKGKIMTVVFENENAISFLQKLDDNSIDLILTDPPYQISRKTGFASKVKKGVERFRVSMDFGEWDNQEHGEHLKLLFGFIEESYRILRKGGTLICFYDLWKIETLRALLETNKFRMIRFIEWCKTNPVPLNSSRTYLSNAREMALVATKGAKPTFNTKYHNGQFVQPIHRDGGKRLHPTQKPLALMKELISIHSNIGDSVVDPFAGSATTLVAGLQENRSVFGCEIDPKYHWVATKRLLEAIDGKENHTG